MASKTAVMLALFANLHLSSKLPSKIIFAHGKNLVIVIRGGWF